MSAGLYNIVAEQGATWNPTWTYRDSSGAPVNLSGYSARMQVRESYSSGAALLNLTTENGGIVLGGAGGTISPIATAEQMAALEIPNTGGTPPVKRFVYDLELVLGAVVIRLLHGVFAVSREVTRP